MMSLVGTRQGETQMENVVYNYSNDCEEEGRTPENQDEEGPMGLRDEPDYYDVWDGLAR
jgi:hypothetical protein